MVFSATTAAPVFLHHVAMSFAALSGLVVYLDINRRVGSILACGSSALSVLSLQPRIVE